MARRKGCLAVRFRAVPRIGGEEQAPNLRHSLEPECYVNSRLYRFPRRARSDFSPALHARWCGRPALRHRQLRFSYETIAYPKRKRRVFQRVYLMALRKPRHHRYPRFVRTFSPRHQPLCWRYTIPTCGPNGHGPLVVSHPARHESGGTRLTKWSSAWRP